MIRNHYFLRHAVFAVISAQIGICLFDVILYVPVNNFSVMSK